MEIKSLRDSSKYWVVLPKENDAPDFIEIVCYKKKGDYTINTVYFYVELNGVKYYYAFSELSLRTLVFKTEKAARDAEIKLKDTKIKSFSYLSAWDKGTPVNWYERKDVSGLDFKLTTPVVRFKQGELILMYEENNEKSLSLGHPAETIDMYGLSNYSAEQMRALCDGWNKPRIKKINEYLSAISEFGVSYTQVVLGEKYYVFIMSDNGQSGKVYCLKCKSVAQTKYINPSVLFEKEDGTEYELVFRSDLGIIFTDENAAKAALDFKLS